LPASPGSTPPGSSLARRRRPSGIGGPGRVAHDAIHG
jgi:hypothetical protein